MPFESKRSIAAGFALGVLSWTAADSLAQSPRTLYTWNGTGNAQGWLKAFGADGNAVQIQNATAGELTATETGADGSTWALSDDANIIAEGGAGIGGMDVSGLSAIEFELGHNGTRDVNVQFYVQATPFFTYLALGPDQPVSPGVKTYSAPLTDLLREQIAYIRVVGINIREHPEDGNLVWTLREVRTLGEPLEEREIATHEPGDSEDGLQGAFANFETTAVEGNDGFQNQTGLSVNTAEPPPGNTGSLHWIDLDGQNGAAVTWGNGTAYAGNSFNQRPSDFSNYHRVIVRMAARSLVPEAISGVGVQYFFQTSDAFTFKQAGAILRLDADGEFHELEFPLSNIPNLAWVMTHGLNLMAHPGGDLAIDVDSIRLAVVEGFRDCNQNRVPDERDLADGTSEDCNSNAMPDECDLQAGQSEDCNQNGVPDDCDLRGDHQTRVLYTWEGIDNVRDWFRAFGTNEATIENTSAGELTATETGAPGSTWAISDSFTTLTEDAPTQGGLDLTGMSALEFDLGHSGVAPVIVQFYVQSTPQFIYVALGPDQPIAPGAATYTAPLGALTPSQITYIRTIGINIRDHTGEGNLVWTLKELRVVGAPLRERDLATHGPDASDSGLQGAVVASDFAAVEGNDGGENQSGLSHNTGASPPGNTGSLRWVDLAGRAGGAVSWFNGTVFQTTTFNERPVDLAPYGKVVIRMAATSAIPEAVESVEVQYYLQRFLEGGNLERLDAVPPQRLPADGGFHELVFPIADLPGRAYTVAHGVDLGEHEAGDLIIDVDNLRAAAVGPTEGDCDGNGAPDECDLAAGRLADADGDKVPDICEAGGFRRGDSNADGKVDLSDAVHTFSFLFLGGAAPLCPDATDSNDDGLADISDGVTTLTRLFLGGPPLPDPGPDRCGLDPAADALGGCDYPASSCP